MPTSRIVGVVPVLCSEEYYIGGNIPTNFSTVQIFLHWPLETFSTVQIFLHWPPETFSAVQIFVHWPPETFSTDIPT